MKKCIKCRVTKALERFSIDTESKDRHSDICKTCERDIRESKEKHIASTTSKSMELFNTGFPSFDKTYGGIVPGSFVLVCGEPGSGRSSFIDKIVRS